MIRQYLHHDKIRAAMGLPKKLPRTGMEPKCINGVWYFLLSSFNAPRKTSKHRMYAICPSCGNYVPAGRLHQHEGSQTCEDAWTNNALASGINRDAIISDRLCKAVQIVALKLSID